MFEAASPSPAAPPPPPLTCPLFPSHPMRVSDECEGAGEELSEYVVSGRDALDSDELAEFKAQMEEFVPWKLSPLGEDPQWVRSCVELLGYAKDQRQASMVDRLA